MGHGFSQNLVTSLLVVSGICGIALSDLPTRKCPGVSA